MRFTIGLVGILGLLAFGCGSSPAKPFDTLKSANLTAFRLQNYDLPPPPPGAAAPQQGMIPGLPPEIGQWAQQALPALQQFLPPGMLPPGMVPGMQQPAAAPPIPPPDAPRFPMSQPNFRILGQVQVLDPELREQLGELLGDPDSFQSGHPQCLYAEMGLSFTPASGGPPNDLLISFSCNQVDARGFAWPHANRGFKPETVKQIAAIVQKIWPG